MRDIGTILYVKRIERGMTQGVLAHKAGIPQPNLSNIEKGKRDITVSTFLQICRALGASPSEILEGSIGKSRPSRHFSLSRAVLERVASAVLHKNIRCSPQERETADLLRKILPGIYKGRLGAREVREAWYRLKELFDEAEIRVLTERVGDERMRMKAA